MTGVSEKRARPGAELGSAPCGSGNPSGSRRTGFRAQLSPRLPALAVLLCATFVLAGCGMGSPAVVEPVAPAPGAQLAAPADPAPEVEVAAAVDSAPEGAVSAAPNQAADAPAPVAAGDPVETTDAVEPALATDVTSAAGQSAPDLATDSAAFAQDPPQVAAAISQEAPQAAAPPQSVAAQFDRPPPPPDPGTGQSLIIEGGSNGRLEVALTFDAGADTGYAPEILDYLRDEGIKATFGMTGVWAEANPELVKRMVDEGHQLINHSWDHSSLTGANTGLPPMTPEEVAQQLNSTESLVREITGGYEMRPYFRPPYGDYDATSLGYLYDNGYYLSIWWTCDSHGWAGWGAQEIIDYCTTNIVEDEILLLHVGAEAAGDFEALPGLIAFFREQGYAFVTMEQMLQP